jgi:hypothetical protein
MKIWRFDENNSLNIYISTKNGPIIFEESRNIFLLKLNDGDIEKFDASDPETDFQKVPKLFSFKIE